MIPINTTCVSGVAISEIDGKTKLLVMKRAKEGFWCHVAGKIEQGETAWQAIAREFFEETGIVVSRLYNSEFVEQFYEASLNTIMVVPSFVVMCPPDQAVTINVEHTEYCWCSLEEAKSLVPFPNQKKLYDHVWQHFVLSQPSDYMLIELT